MYNKIYNYLLMRIIINYYKGGSMKLFYLSIGFISLILGCVGVALPVLPTAPFLLVSSWGFAKGSDRFNNWFKSTKLYKNNLESFERERTMTRNTKVKLLAIATIMLGFVFFRYDVLPMRIVILSLIAFKYYYFLRVIKTVD